jgi:hypothetical protein
MAFLGVASLIGVIVSHVIVLFEFIEEMHEKGEPFEQAIRRRDRAVAASPDHRIRDDPRAISASKPRRSTVAAVVLRANRRIGRGDLHHAATGAGAL